MKKLIVKPSLFLTPDKEKTKIEKIEEAWKTDDFIVIPSEFSYEIIENNVDILKQAREEINNLKEYGAKFKDGFEIHVNKADVLEIIDKLIAESEEVND